MSVVFILCGISSISEKSLKIVFVYNGLPTSQIVDVKYLRLGTDNLVADFLGNKKFSWISSAIKSSYFAS